MPDDMHNMAQRFANDIVDAWSMLENMCRIKQYPMDIAMNMVNAYIHNGLTQFQAIRKVYHEVRMS
jgi:hypothetical protein